VETLLHAHPLLALLSPTLRRVLCAPAALPSTTTTTNPPPQSPSTHLTPCTHPLKCNRIRDAGLAALVSAIARLSTLRRLLAREALRTLSWELVEETATVGAGQGIGALRVMHVTFCTAGGTRSATRVRAGGAVPAYHYWALVRAL
jgi:hypothetical protein